MGKKCKSSNEDRKKKKEFTVLRNALADGIKSEQEDTRRICKSLYDSRIEITEVPDFNIINDEEKVYYAVEHFRVDHQIRSKHGKIGAASIKFQSDNEKIRLKYKDDVSNNLMNVMNELNKSIEGQLNRTFNAQYEDILKSLEYSLNNHAPKINIFKEKYAQSELSNYCFKSVMLIEVVSDFSRIYKCSYRKVKRNFGGLMPIFDDVLDIILSDKYKNVDYYVLFFNSYLGSMTQTIALDNKNIKESLKRNGINIVHNCSFEKYLINTEDKAVELKMGEAVAKDDKIDSHYEINYKLCNNELFIPAVQTAAKEALELRDTRKEYTVDYCTLFFIEVYGKNIKGWRKYKNTDLYLADIVIDKRTETRRIKRFDELYPIEKIY